MSDAERIKLLETFNGKRWQVTASRGGRKASAQHASRAKARRGARAALRLMEAFNATSSAPPPGEGGTR